MIERAVFKPVSRHGGWDALNAVVQLEALGPLSIASLRELLTQAGWSDDDMDLLERQLAEDDEATNIVEGLKRAVLTAMHLRDQPILDKFQDEIFRLPLDSQLAILGPPGTGKTTTLVRRLRQKIDAEYLDEDEKGLIEESAENGLPHPQSWLMFTPTELLKHYVREAFAREGVPAPDGRIRTWDEHRRELARRSLPVLRSAAGGTLVLNDRLAILQEDALADQIGWFEDFDAHQAAEFVARLRDGAAVLIAAQDPDVRRLGERVSGVLAAIAGPIAALSALAGLFGDLRRVASELGDSVAEQLRRPLAHHLRRDPAFLDDLARFLTTLGVEDDEDGDDVDVDGDVDEDGDDEPVLAPGSRKAAQAAFLRAVRGGAVAQARGRASGGKSRNGQVLQWVQGRDVALPELRPIGQIVTVQRAARRLLGAPTGFVRGIPARHRAFRRQRMADGRWYRDTGAPGRDVTSPEVDLILLAMLRSARAMLNDGGLMQRLGERAPTILADITRLQRNQILVDEATDFSPVQLACMAALASPWTDSFFACGDFNQRLTQWGSRSAEHLRWVLPDIDVRHIDVSYRQSRRLNDLARLLAAEGDATPASRTPDQLDNVGVMPVLGMGLGDPGALVEWLAARIREIERALGSLPTVAVLVNDAAAMQTVARALNEALAPDSIRAVACANGQSIGQGNDVRVFEVEHIKGLEFEAVFFVDVDRLEQHEPDLFARYLYVGATRAATYLGLTCSTAAAPRSLDHVLPLMGEHWRS